MRGSKGTCVLVTVLVFVWLLPPSTSAQGTPPKASDKLTEQADSPEGPTEPSFAPKGKIPEFLIGKWAAETVIEDPEDPDTKIVEEVVYEFLPSGRFKAESKSRITAKGKTTELAPELETAASGAFALEDVSEKAFKMKACHGRECRSSQEEVIERVDKNTLRGKSGTVLRRMRSAK